MSQEENVALQQKLGSLIGAREIERLGEVFASDVVDHDPAPGQEPGAGGLIGFWSTFLTAFPDLTLEPEVLSVDDEHVTVVLSVSGTQTGPFLGHEATGKSVTVRGIQVAKVADGKIVERWGATDELGILKQIGTV